MDFSVLLDIYDKYSAYGTDFESAVYAINPAVIDKGSGIFLLDLLEKGRQHKVAEGCGVHEASRKGEQIWIDMMTKEFPESMFSSHIQYYHATPAEYSARPEDKKESQVRMPDVLQGSIARHMFRLALPNVGGMLAIILFNITDTFFVARLGDEALAAMGFTFPVVLLIGAVSTGISSGAGSLLARAAGAGDRKFMQRIASDGILLSLAAVIALSIVGLATARPLFTALGAEGRVLELVLDYMGTWYAGIVFVIMPPVSDGSMRALGDMKRPLYVMLTVAILNFLLDPLLIFGGLGLPAMGIQGAAVATVISRGIGAGVSLGFVHFRYRLLNYRYESLGQLLASWKRILHIGIPAALIRLLPQLVRTLLTRLAAGNGGTAAVAALAAGSRIEGFAMILSMAVGVSLVPLMGQNYGAGKHDRVQESRALLVRLSWIFGIALSLGAWFGAGALGRIFSSSQDVLNYVRIYLVLLMAGSAGLNLYNWLGEGLNALGKPRMALGINLYGTLFILIPALYLGSLLGGFTGMLAGLAIGQTVLGLAAVLVSKSHFSRMASSP